jgi:hypothetical protein
VKEFDVSVHVPTKARIDSDSIARIIEKEQHTLLGDKDRYIDDDGIIYETDYRFNGRDKVRAATEEEIELYNALVIVENHFREYRRKIQ